MVNFKSVSAFLVLTLLGIALAGMYYSIPLWFFLVPVIPYVIILIYGSSYVQSQFFMPVVHRGDDRYEEVAITFDDGPSPKTTPRILDILKEHEVTAAFFCIGKNVEAYPELMQRISDEGHVIGNHSYSHNFFFNLLSQDNMVREIRNTNKIIQKTIRKRIHLFRPPYGVTTPTLAKAVKKAKMTSVGWSLRSFDTTMKDPEKLVKKIKRKLRPGDVILLHDNHEVTVEALPAIIENIDDRGYAIIPVDQLLDVHAYV